MVEIQSTKSRKTKKKPPKETTEMSGLEENNLFRRDIHSK